jgi:hypothetical protein
MIFGLAVVIIVCQSLVLSFVLKIKVRQITSPPSLLDGYLPGGIIDKDELDSRLMLKRNWDGLM